jgi:hypothetical protein
LPKDGVVVIVGKAWLPCPEADFRNTLISDESALRIADCNSINAVSFFIGTHNETLSVAMRVYNPNRSPFKIES